MVKLSPLLQWQNWGRRSSRIKPKLVILLTRTREATTKAARVGRNSDLLPAAKVLHPPITEVQDISLSLRRNSKRISRERLLPKTTVAGRDSPVTLVVEVHHQTRRLVLKNLRWT